MNNKKNLTMTALIYFLIFAVYNVFVFFVFDDLGSVFWASYIFMVLTYLGHIFCIFSIAKNLSVNTVFFGIPLASFSIYFVAAEFFCSMVFMIFRDQASVFLAVVVQVLLLCVFLVIAILSIMSRDAVQHVDDKIKQNVNIIKGINVDIEMLMQRSTDSSVTMALKKLSETIRYSDPMTHEIVALQEQMIMQNIAELRVAFDNQNMERVKELCNTVNLLFIERNKKLMIAK